MNSESEQTLSMEELMARNRPAHMNRQLHPSVPDSVPQNLPSVVEPQNRLITAQEWREMESLLLELCQAEQTQIGLLERQLKSQTICATKEQMDELIRQTRELRNLVERVGRKNEKRSLLSKLRPPSLHLPRPEGPGLFLLLWVLATLLLFWFVLAR